MSINYFNYSCLLNIEIETLDNKLIIEFYIVSFPCVLQNSLQF